MAILATAIVWALLQQPTSALNAAWGVVLPDDQALVFATARLCNRPGAGAADATWTPDADTIRRLEAVLAAELQAAIDLQSDPAKRLLAADYYRQYAGLVIAGRRIVYINGVHRVGVQRDTKGSWKTIASRTCDGGLLAFGAEYDVATGAISKVLFNGGGRGNRPWHAGSPSGEALPRELSALLSRTPYEGRIETWCQGTFDGSEPAGFAVALVTARGKIYAAVRQDARIVMLADFRGGADLKCYTRRDAEKLSASIRASETIHGSITPRWDSTVICGFVDDTEAQCWQYSPSEKKFVRVGGWLT